MPVIINEFEVLIEEPAEASEASSQGPPKETPSAFTPVDLDDVNRWLEQRAERLRAD